MSDPKLITESLTLSGEPSDESIARPTPSLVSSEEDAFGAMMAVRYSCLFSCRRSNDQLADFTWQNDSEATGFTRQVPELSPIELLRDERRSVDETGRTSSHNLQEPLPQIDASATTLSQDCDRTGALALHEMHPVPENDGDSVLAVSNERPPPEGQSKL